MDQIRVGLRMRTTMVFMVGLLNSPPSYLAKFSTIPNRTRWRVGHEVEGRVGHEVEGAPPPSRQTLQTSETIPRLV